MVHASGDVYVPVQIVDRRSASAIPQPASRSVGSVIENRRLFQRRFVIGQQPAMIAMPESDVDLVLSGIQRQPRALVASLLQRDSPIIAVPACTGYGAPYGHRPAEFFGARSDIQRVQKEGAAVGRCQHIKRSRGDVDDRSAGDPQHG